MTDTRLTDVMRDGYAAQVLGRGSIDGVRATFSRHAADPAFVERARSELARCEGISKARNNSRGTSAFVEQQHARFLTEMLAQKASAKPA